MRCGEHGRGLLGDPGALEVLTYNDAIMMIGGLFVAALFNDAARSPPTRHPGFNGTLMFTRYGRRRRSGKRFSVAHRSTVPDAHTYFRQPAS